jgi:C4-dicarboxylate-specific signal transduction histidine kinase
MTGKTTVYPAVGVTTGQRGLYLSYPVYLIGSNKPEGVLVLKLGLHEIETFLCHDKAPFVIISPQGVIFAGNHSEWLFGLTNTLSQEQLRELRNSRQFVNQRLTPLNWDIDLSQHSLSINTQRYTVISEPIFSPQWQLVSWYSETRSAPLTSTQIIVFAAGTVMALILYTCLFAFRLNMSKRRQAELKQTKQKVQLENTIARRTREIEGINQELTRELAERRRVQAKWESNIHELEEFNRLAVGRELRMIELKQEINALLEELGQSEKYEIVNMPSGQEELNPDSTQHSEPDETETTE